MIMNLLLYPGNIDRIWYSYVVRSSCYQETQKNSLTLVWCDYGICHS